MKTCRIVSLLLAASFLLGVHDGFVALWKDGWLECLDLQPLDRIALGELVAGLVGGQVDHCPPGSNSVRRGIECKAQVHKCASFLVYYSRF